MSELPEVSEFVDLPTEIDTSQPHIARMYDYYLGGKNHFAADRELADKVIAAIPGMRTGPRENREFLGRTVRFLAGEAGIRQFLDIGTGLPTTNSVHEVAQQVAPSSRVVYVDNDPLVLTHARALLTSSEEGRTAYIQADLHNPQEILSFAQSSRELKGPWQELRGLQRSMGGSGSLGSREPEGSCCSAAVSRSWRAMAAYLMAVVSSMPNTAARCRGSAPQVRASSSCRSTRSRSRVAVRPRHDPASQFSLTARVVMAVCWLMIRCGLAVPGQRRPRCCSQARSRLLVRSSSGRAVPAMTSRRLPRSTSPR